MIGKKGQGLSEYAMIGALVVVVALGGLTLLGGKLSNLFGGMIGKPKPPVLAVTSPSTSPQSAPDLPGTAETPAEPRQPMQTLPASPVTFKLPSGTLLNLGMPTDVTESVQTIGANGTLIMVGTSIKSMAEQLLASGDINQEQANTLMRLANQAHHMAEIQKTLETISASYGSDTERFKNAPVTIEGKTYANAYEAALSIGYNDETSARGGELQEFWDLYRNATGAVYMWPPELKAVLEYHAKTVNDLTDSTRVSIRDIMVYNSGTPDKLADMMVNTMTHKKSASICQMDSGNQDSGLQCSGT
jgi:hypothetical protein